MAMVLNLVPIASILFSCKSRAIERDRMQSAELIVVTTAIGAAMWAADIEGKKPINPVAEIQAGVQGQSKGSDEAAEVVMSSDSKKEL